MRQLYTFTALAALLATAHPTVAQTPEPPKDLLRPKDAVAADTVQPWRRGGFGSLNFTQTSLSNWAGGGENSLALTGLASLYLRYRRG